MKHYKIHTLEYIILCLLVLLLLLFSYLILTINYSYQKDVIIKIENHNLYLKNILFKELNLNKYEIKILFNDEVLFYNIEIVDVDTDGNILIKNKELLNLFKESNWEIYTSKIILSNQKIYEVIFDFIIKIFQFK
ncbi:MAG1140 family protein [Mycoplasmopsis felis]|uniref:MAG1140 family protein n=1 Tax=Mycoplasmopsis felis TaxID=33923 RepID=UPI003B82CB32